VFLAPSRSDLGESLLITTLLGIPLGKPDSKTPTRPEGEEIEGSRLQVRPGPHVRIPNGENGWKVDGRTHK